MKIFFTGGGTAGHLYPIVSIVREIKKIDPERKFQFFFLGPRNNFVDAIFRDEGIVVKNISAGKMRRYFSLMNIYDFFIRTPIGIIQAFLYIYFNPPDLIFSKGGYGSLPAAIAGRLLLVPIFTHESDIVSGVANRFIEKSALEVFCSFPVTRENIRLPLEKIIAVGNPIRSEISVGSREKAKVIFNLSGARPVILILGGSQGARSINQKILAILGELLEDYEIIHQTGEANFMQVASQSGILVSEGKQEYYHPVSFIGEKDLPHAYAAADLVISRAGAGSIFEIAASGKPSILVPLAGSAQNHQLKNAVAYKETGAAIVVEEAEFTPRFMLDRVKSLFAETEEMEEMGRCAKEFARPEAAKIIAE
ncbi:MAG: UDP-N-acetylglucosamine--N-acetylmuramyl-(pentapeptide) pyrophosphoryl-undecaprenol N-acetylglucosamine transferase, partial [Candidatus Nealsonbacteria bacterium]|nr:UDP-N-acetylglucosamine--N-acetylmuramyl-(pentapeptide) pyrophosphoryl-undecaprenol N-acetylglucosamine transferase [Candidatus Nealsonbacteria bacterium]